MSTLDLERCTLCSAERGLGEKPGVTPGRIKLVSENRFKGPKLPSSPELSTDPKERRILSSPSLKRKMGASVEQSSGSRAIAKLQCWKPWETNPGAPLLGMLESKS